MPTLVPVKWYDQISHVLPHFNLLDLRNAMVPLTVPSASQVAYLNPNGSTRPKGHATPHIHHFGIGKWMVLLMIPSASCDTDTIQWHNMISSFQLPCPKEHMMSFSMPFALCDANTGAIGITHTKSHDTPYFDHYVLI